MKYVLDEIKNLIKIQKLLKSHVQILNSLVIELEIQNFV